MIDELALRARGEITHDYDTTSELTYKLIAWAVGYGGPILETSKQGWRLT
jgi:hypothetical protein